MATEPKDKGPTGRAPLQVNSPSDRVKHPAEEWPQAFQRLYILEVVIVMFLATCIVLLAGFLGFWVATGCGGNIHGRLVQLIGGMNKGWKVCLVILIPLFFRPIFKFLFFLKEGPLGTKTELPPSAEPQASADYHSEQ